MQHCKGNADYDFLQVVFEWIFYQLPPRSDNTFIRNMYDFYTTRGGLSKKQLQVLLDTVHRIKEEPPFSPATLEALIKKKASKTKSALPPSKPLYTEDTASLDKISAILQLAPQHKAALQYRARLITGQLLTPADKDDLSRFLHLLSSKK